jgi:hypothetical protein
MAASVWHPWSRAFPSSCKHTRLTATTTLLHLLYKLTSSRHVSELALPMAIQHLPPQSQPQKEEAWGVTGGQITPSWPTASRRLIKPAAWPCLLPRPLYSTLEQPGLPAVTEPWGMVRVAPGRRGVFITLTWGLVMRMASRQAATLAARGTRPTTCASPLNPHVHEAHFALLLQRALNAGDPADCLDVLVTLLSPCCLMTRGREFFAYGLAMPASTYITLLAPPYRD